jgi:hypothetical protein
MKTNPLPTSHSIQRAALAAILAVVAAAPAAAQVVAALADQRVDIVAPRLDVRTVCPTVDADMLTALSRVAMQHRESARLDVLFGIDGRRIGEVVVSGGPPAYRRATRNAVLMLACDNGRAGAQAVRMQVVFKDL